MRSALLFVSVAALSSVAGCGKEIGDACLNDSECDPNGQRDCDRSQDDGYCTIQGCDYNSCPEDSWCIRFFTGGFTNRTCNHVEEDNVPDVDDVDGDGDRIESLVDDCSLDELCSLEDLCVPRSSESRYCMATCSDNGDCRDGYECRTIELMRAHGGEPVLEPGKVVDESSPKFCAQQPVN
jgi:hypothetical protein